MGKATVDDAVKHGVQRSAPTALFSCGIPSFHEHLREKRALRMR